MLFIFPEASDLSQKTQPKLFEDSTVANTAVRDQDLYDAYSDAVRMALEQLHERQRPFGHIQLSLGPTGPATPMLSRVVFLPPAATAPFGEEQPVEAIKERIDRASARLAELTLITTDENLPFNGSSAAQAMRFIKSEAVGFPSMFVLADGTLRLSWSDAQQGLYFGLQFLLPPDVVHFTAVGAPLPGGKVRRSSGWAAASDALTIARTMGLEGLVRIDQH